MEENKVNKITQKIDNIDNKLNEITTEIDLVITDVSKELDDVNTQIKEVDEEIAVTKLELEIINKELNIYNENITVEDVEEDKEDKVTDLLKEIDDITTEKSDDIPADQEEPAEEKSDETKPAEEKADEPKPAEEKADEPKPTEEKSDEPKPTEEKADEPKPTEEKADEPKPDEEKPSKEVKTTPTIVLDFLDDDEPEEEQSKIQIIRPLAEREKEREKAKKQNQKAKLKKKPEIRKLVELPELDEIVEIDEIGVLSEKVETKVKEVDKSKKKNQTQKKKAFSTFLKSKSKDNSKEIDEILDSDSDSDTKSKVKKNDFFIFFIITLVLVLITACLYGWGIVSKFLDAYEKSVPEVVLDEIVASLNEGDYIDLIYYAEFDVNSFENISDVISNVQLDKPATYEYAKDKSTPYNYYLIRDGIKIGEISLYAVDSTNVFNLPTYALGWVTFDLTPIDAITFTVPQNSTIKVNNMTIDTDKYITTQIEVANFSDKYIAYQDEISITGFMATPSIDVYYNDIKLTNQGNDYVILLDENNYNTISNLAIEVAKKYANFTSNDLALEDIEMYFDKSTDTYNKVKTYDGKYYNSHSSFEFSDVSVNDIRMLNDDIIQANVTFNYTIVSYSGRFDYPSDYTIYFDSSTKKVISLGMN